MAIDSKKLSDFLNKIKLEQIYNAVVIFIVALILCLATFAIYRPLTTSQFNLLQELAELTSNPGYGSDFAATATHPSRSIS